MKRGRAGRNRKKPKEQKVNEHSFPWLPYLTPLFSTHTSSYSVPFVLSVRSSSRPEQEGALPRHVLAVTHRSRASVLRVDAARELTSTGGQGTRTCLCSSGGLRQPDRSVSTCLCWDTFLTASSALISSDKSDNDGRKWQSWSFCTEQQLCALTGNAGSSLCAITCYLSPCHLDALLANLSNVYFITSICNWHT